MFNTYKIGGIILMLISIAISISSYKKFLTIQNGKIVEVKVIEIPISCEKSNKNLKAYFRFKFNGKEYAKNIKGKYCETLKNNKILKMKTNSDNSTFVFVDESLTIQYISTACLFLMGFLLLFKKKKNE